MVDENKLRELKNRIESAKSSNTTITKKNKELILADEISPDTCRLWDLKTNKKLDKDRFRRDSGNVEDAYNEVLERLKLKI